MYSPVIGIGVTHRIQGGKWQGAFAVTPCLLLSIRLVFPYLTLILILPLFQYKQIS